MVKTSSSLLSFSLLAMVILYSLANVYTLRPVEAQSPYALSKITGFNEDIVGADYDPIENILWVLTTADEGSFQVARMYSVNATTDDIITSAVVFNQTDTNNQYYDFGCNYPYCYFVDGADDAALPGGHVFRADITDATANLNSAIDVSQAVQTSGAVAADPTDLHVTTAGSFGGSTLVYTINSYATNTAVIQFARLDGLTPDLDAISDDVDTLFSGASAVRGIIQSDWSKRSAPEFDFAAIGTGSSSAGLYVYSMDADSLTCGPVSISDVDTESGIVIDHIDYGNVYIGLANGDIGVRRMSDCAHLYTIDAADTGLSNTVFDFTIVNIGEEKYLVARDIGTGGNISFMPWNGTAFTTYDFIINSVPSSSQGDAGQGVSSVSQRNPTIGMIVNAFDAGKMYIPMTNTDRAVLVIDIASSFLGGDDDPDGFENPATGGGSSGMVVDLVNAPDTFLTGLLTVDTEQANMIATGIVHGLFLIVPMLYMMSAAKKGGQTPQIPLFVWAILALMAGGICVSLGWMPILFLFAEVVVIVAAFAFLVSRGVGIT